MPQSENAWKWKCSFSSLATSQGLNTAFQQMYVPLFKKKLFYYPANSPPTYCSIVGELFMQMFGQFCVQQFSCLTVLCSTVQLPDSAVYNSQSIVQCCDQQSDGWTVGVSNYTIVRTLLSQTVQWVGPCWVQHSNFVSGLDWSGQVILINKSHLGVRGGTSYQLPY